MKQPYFSVIAKNANAEQKEDFIRIIEETLQEIAEKGLDRKSLSASLNNSEFKYREADFGSYPKGLMYGLQMLETWLYDDSRPFAEIELLDIYRDLKKAVETSYYEDMGIRIRAW